MKDWQIPLSDLEFDRDEIDAVVETLKSGWLTMGAATEQFETQFAEWNHVNFAFAVSSCTAALHLACMALDLGPGDDVILPALTFVATANAVRYTGATPVFADIVSEDDLTISPAAIESLITDRTKAIIVMHYAGYPCDMPEIMHIAEKHNLYVIEDAAHAVGAQLNGQYMGTVGDVGCFSFFSNKNLVTGEGGMLVTNNPEIAERLKLLRSHGMTTLTWDRHKGHASSYDVVELGYNYRIDEIRATIGIFQLQKLEKNNQTRRELKKYYHRQLKKHCPQIHVPFTDHPGITSAHIMPVLIPLTMARNSIMDQLKLGGIQTSMHYPPIYSFSSYRKSENGKYSLPITENIASRELTLPLYPGLTMDQINQVVDCLCEAMIVKNIC